jgi:hypothetical protein
MIIQRFLKLSVVSFFPNASFQVKNASLDRALRCDIFFQGKELSLMTLMPYNSF